MVLDVILSLSVYMVRSLKVFMVMDCVNVILY